jgi:hypothetical protein
MTQIPPEAPDAIIEVLDKLVDMAIDNKQPSFRDLVRAAGLDPGYDFIGASLRDLDFRDEDLRGFDFSEADLTGADFRRANIVGVRFDGADLTGAIGLLSGWETWHETKTDINEFSETLRMELDKVVTSAATIVTRVASGDISDGQTLVLSIREAFRELQDKPGLDIEPICLDDRGVFIYHTWTGIIGRTLGSQWSQRPGFADWVMHRIREMGGGYLTWKDRYSSDPNFELELAVRPRRYQRRTILAFRRVAIAPGQHCIVGVEGHDVVI